MSKGTYTKLTELNREDDYNPLKNSAFFKKRIKTEEDQLNEILQELIKFRFTYQ